MQHYLMTVMIVTALSAALAFGCAPTPGEYDTHCNLVGGKTEEFPTGSGFEWRAKHRSEPTGPGPNYWSENNVTKDDRGLHLRIAREWGQWSCAEVVMTRTLGYGAYQWDLNADIQHFDSHAVFGAFLYTCYPGSPDKELEAVGLEASRWFDLFDDTNPAENWQEFTVTLKEGESTSGAALASTTIENPTNHLEMTLQIAPPAGDSDGVRGYQQIAHLTRPSFHVGEHTMEIALVKAINPSSGWKLNWIARYELTYKIELLGSPERVRVTVVRVERVVPDPPGKAPETISPRFRLRVNHPRSFQHLLLTPVTEGPRYRFSTLSTRIRLIMRWTEGRVEFSTFDLDTGRRLSCTTREGDLVPVPVSEDHVDEPRIRMNLWIKDGDQSRIKRVHEVTITDFRFTPLVSPSPFEILAPNCVNLFR